MIEETLIGLENKTLTPVKQCEDGVCMANKLKKEECLIDWSKTNIEIHNLVRGICRCPSAYFIFNEKIIKVLETEPIGGAGEVGKIVNSDKTGIYVGCGTGLLQIIFLEFQMRLCFPLINPGIFHILSILERQ